MMEPDQSEVTLISINEEAGFSVICRVCGDIEVI